MLKTFILFLGLVMASSTVARAQSPSSEAMAAARSLVATLRLTDQYKVLLPSIIFNLRPVLTQDRPEIERDFDAVTPIAANEYASYLNSMVDAAAALYARDFTVEDLREIEAFYRRPAGQKLLEKSADLTRRSTQIGDEISRKASDALRLRITQLLRDKGHKF